MNYCYLSDAENISEDKSLNMRSKLIQKGYAHVLRSPQKRNSASEASANISVSSVSSVSSTDCATSDYTSRSVVSNDHTYESLRFCNNGGRSSLESFLLLSGSGRKKRAAIKRRQILPKYQIVELDARYLRALYKHPRSNYAMFK